MDDLLHTESNNKRPWFSNNEDEEQPGRKRVILEETKVQCRNELALSAVMRGERNQTTIEENKENEPMEVDAAEFQENNVDLSNPKQELRYLYVECPARNFASTNTLAVPEFERPDTPFRITEDEESDVEMAIISVLDTDLKASTKVDLVEQACTNSSTLHQTVNQHALNSFSETITPNQTCWQPRYHLLSPQILQLIFLNINPKLDIRPPQDYDENLDLDILSCSLVCRTWHAVAFPLVQPDLFFLRLHKFWTLPPLHRLRALLSLSNALGLNYPSYIRGIDLNPNCLLQVKSLLADTRTIQKLIENAPGFAGVTVYLESDKEDACEVVRDLFELCAASLHHLRIFDPHNRQSMGWGLLKAFWASITPFVAGVREFTLFENAYDECAMFEHGLEVVVNGFLAGLEKVCINDMRWDRDLITALKNHVWVRECELVDMIWVDEDEIIEVLRCWGKLKKLVIDGGIVGTGKMLDTLMETCCGSLEELILRRELDSDGLSPAGGLEFDHIGFASALTGFLSWPGQRLRVLEIDLPPNESRSLGNDLWSAILEYGVELEVLRLLFLKKMTGKKIKRHSHIQLYKLKVFDLRGCSAMDPNALEMVIRHCGKLCEVTFPATMKNEGILNRMKSEYGFQLQNANGRKTGVWIKDLEDRLHPDNDTEMML